MKHKATAGWKAAMGYTCSCGRWFHDWNEFNAHLAEETND